MRTMCRASVSAVTSAVVTFHSGYSWQFFPTTIQNLSRNNHIVTKHHQRIHNPPSPRDGLTSSSRGCKTLQSRWISRSLLSGYWRVENARRRPGRETRWNSSGTRLRGPRPGTQLLSWLHLRLVSTPTPAVLRPSSPEASGLQVLPPVCLFNAQLTRNGSRSAMHTLRLPSELCI